MLYWICNATFHPNYEEILHFANVTLCQTLIFTQTTKENIQFTLILSYTNTNCQDFYLKSYNLPNLNICKNVCKSHNLHTFCLKLARHATICLIYNENPTFTKLVILVFHHFVTLCQTFNNSFVTLCQTSNNFLHYPCFPPFCDILPNFHHQFRDIMPNFQQQFCDIMPNFQQQFCDIWLILSIVNSMVDSFYSRFYSWFYSWFYSRFYSCFYRL